MKSCSIFLSHIDEEALLSSITSSFPKTKAEIKGSNANWSQVKIIRKTGWFGQSTITFSLLSESNMTDFKYFIKGMTELMTPFSTSEFDIQQNLLPQVQKAKGTLSIFADSGFDLFLDGIFDIAQEYQAKVLIDGLYWYDGDKNLLLDMSKEFIETSKEPVIDNSTYMPRVEGFQPIDLQPKKVFSF